LKQSFTFRKKVLIYENELFVTVGKNGTIMTSPDGVTWSLQTTNILKTLQSATYGNGMFVVVGDDGTIFISPEV
jgi:hypothetical protein